METNNINMIRDALVKAETLLAIATYDDGVIIEEVNKIRDEIKNALSAPPRNCDIGTADEQAQRFHEFCKRNQSPIQGMCSSSCPCKHQPDMCHCYAAWSQMPYKKGEADEQ